MTPDYRVLRINLATARPAPGEQLIGPGVNVEAITPLFIPVGSGLTYQVGENHDAIEAEFSPPFVMCPAANEGVRFANPAGAGIAIILVSFGGLQPSA